MGVWSNIKAGLVADGERRKVEREVYKEEYHKQKLAALKGKAKRDAKNAVAPKKTTRTKPSKGGKFSEYKPKSLLDNDKGLF